ncbi:DUF3307 domain-containing protein [Pleomorphovibrio marinus]|uniref:DUF3307 domain-containing protein n=1 Tax=Pleomorphovibrio marinus TaxID=2164132 RepID=UPI000E0BAD9F|nr:DUF3307 domain-containing protein [Pleomorphovibrio marinus]
MILVKLLLAHLIGDFFLQPDAWVKTKEQHKLRAYQFYLHILIHGLLVYVMVWDADFWPYALVIAVSHGVIDGIKLYAQKENTKRKWFFWDQFAHVLVLLAIFQWVEGHSWKEWLMYEGKIWLLVTMALFLTLPASIFIKTFISKWTPIAVDSEESDSLAEAGKYIGILERLFVFVFIISGRYEAIGFLVAAKSVFRFGDLRQTGDRKLTEYILIGTLFSFGLAILGGLLYVKFQPWL